MRQGLAIRVLVFVVVVAAGAMLRVWGLGSKPPTGDEAESSINAMTILEHGVPMDRYLGLPIFENTLTEFSPGDREYEFRDSSYSAKHVAIYHGWLPLYAMAGSFKVFGVKPDEVGGELRVRHSMQEMRWRTAAARAPAVVFGLGFLVIVFVAGWEMCSERAAWAALAVGAFARPFVFLSREARYHSATVMLATLCCWLLWRCRTKGKWGDFVWLGVGMVLLFHTHLISFVVACCAGAVLLPAYLVRRGALAKLLVAGAIVLAGTAPWIAWSGMLTQTTHIPPARWFLSYPGDLLYYPLKKLPDAWVPLLCAIWIVMIVVAGNRLPRRLVEPIVRRLPVLLFLLTWIFLGFVAFTFLIPAASYFYKRLTLAVLGPGVLFGAIFFAAVMRSFRARTHVAAPAVVFLVLIAISGQSYLSSYFDKPDKHDAWTAVEHLRLMKMEAGTKVYCTPNDQLTLTFLTGLPVQSVAPVRKSFLDEYPGPVVVIESATPFQDLTAEEVREMARRRGEVISDDEARRLASALSTRLLRERVAQRAASVEPRLEEPPAFVDEAMELQRIKTEQFQAEWIQWGTNNPVLRGYEMRDFSYWWQVFFYRFVEPEKRMGERLNYAQRIRSAKAEVLPTQWVFYRCPARAAAEVSAEVTP
ncbi:MAG TPA: glycosyltransferase family 39 protein [Tepidisphaeraceae bacterium]|jgi:hypothetical protein